MVYRCANKQASGYAVYTNVVPGGGFRGYGSSQSAFAIECAMNDLAKALGLDPFAVRRLNMIRPGDWMESVWSDPTDVDFGSYGLDQCMDRVQEALASGRGETKPEGDDWLEGKGIALAMLECGPPTEHRSGAEMRLLADGTYHLAVGSTEMGNGSVTSHRQLAAEGCWVARCARSRSSTPTPIAQRMIRALSRAPALWLFLAAPAPLPRAVRRPDLRHPISPRSRIPKPDRAQAKPSTTRLIVPGGSGCSMWVARSRVCY